MNKLFKGDCIDVMKTIPDDSVDMIFTDLPYGTTRNKWDSIVPLDEMWEQYDRIIKSGGAVCLFSQQPFTSKLINSNINNFRYEWVIEKDNATGFLNARRMPLKAHDNVVVFYDKLPLYNPQFTEGKPYKVKNHGNSTNYGAYKVEYESINDGKRFPRDVVKFNTKIQNGTVHPTQKAINVLEYFIKTYTNEGETVLDSCMGSGSTGVACMNLNRDFVGIEKEPEYFNIAKDRILKAKKENLPVS